MTGKLRIRIDGVWVVLTMLFASCSKPYTPDTSVPSQDFLVLRDGETACDFPAEGGSWQIDFTASTAWKVSQVVSLLAEWYHFAPKHGDAGTGSVTVTLLPNTTDEPRSAEIRIAAGRAEQIVTVTQQAGHVELTPEAEVRAYLERLYRDADGEHWRFNANWGSDKPLSEWSGVRYENGLLHLWLGEKNLKGRMDFSGCTALVELHCAKNSLTEIDVSGCQLLAEIDCTNNEITSLNVSGCSSLQVLMCGYNQLTRLDVSHTPSLKRFNCPYNRISSLDISSCPWISTLDCAVNNLSSLDVAGRSALNHLYCYGNHLTELNLSECDQLFLVNCGSNLLTRLIVSGCHRLDRLFCYDNRLEKLDLTDLTAILVHFYGQGNRFERLDLTDFRQLTQLDCSDNSLQSLVLTGCTALQILRCARNALSVLDLSSCGMLGQVDCTDNRLTALDCTNIPYLWRLYCTDNPILSTIPEAFDRLEVFEHDARYEYRTEMDPVTGEAYTTVTDLGCGWWYPGEPEQGYHGR